METVCMITKCSRRWADRCMALWIVLRWWRWSLLRAIHRRAHEWTIFQAVFASMKAVGVSRDKCVGIRRWIDVVSMTILIVAIRFHQHFSLRLIGIVFLQMFWGQWFAEWQLFWISNAQILAEWNDRFECVDWVIYSAIQISEIGKLQWKIREKYC